MTLNDFEPSQHAHLGPIYNYTGQLGMGRRCAVRVGAHMGYPVYPMAVMHAASGLGELGLGEMGLGEMGGHHEIWHSLKHIHKWGVA